MKTSLCWRQLEIWVTNLSRKYLIKSWINNLSFVLVIGNMGTHISLSKQSAMSRRVKIVGFSIWFKNKQIVEIYSSQLQFLTQIDYSFFTKSYFSLKNVGGPSSLFNHPSLSKTFSKNMSYRGCYPLLLLHYRH